MNLFVVALLIIQLIGIINGMIFFFIIAKINIKDWIFLNSCSLSSILLIIGYILSIYFQNNFVLYTSMTFIMYFGCYGICKSTWKGVGALTQIVHISMILNAAAIFYEALINKNFQILLFGFIVGTIINLLYKVCQKRYFKVRKDILKKNPILSNYF